MYNEKDNNEYLYFRVSDYDQEHGSIDICANIKLFYCKTKKDASIYREYLGKKHTQAATKKYNPYLEIRTSPSLCFTVGARKNLKSHNVHF